MSDLTLVSGSEFESFLSVERDWNSGISQKVPNSGTKSFIKKDGFSPKTCMISVNVETFFI